MIFLDTSFIVSLEVETDTNHDKALRILKDLLENKYGEVVTSDYIFDESVTVTFARTKNLDKAVELGKRLKMSSKIHKVDELNFEYGWEIFKSQRGTKFSFTDCTTLSLMDKTGAKHIATFYKDFKRIKEINVVCE